MKAFELMGVTVVGLVDRLVYLFQPLRFDEAVSYLDYASKPVYLLLSLYIAPVNHIFHTLLVHFSTRLFGDHVWSMRLPALIAGTLLIPLTYLFADQFYGREPALVASAFVAISPVLIDYSTNSRGYTIVCACTLLLFLIGRLLLFKADPVLFLLLVVTASIGLFTIPTMLLPAVAVLLWIVMSVRGRPVKYLRPFSKAVGTSLFITSLVTLICYLPVLMVSGWRSLTANSYVKGLNSGSFLTQNVAFFRQTWQLWNMGLPRWLTVLLVCGFIISLLLPGKSGDRQRRLITAILIACLLILSAFRFAPFPRVWLFLLPIFFASSVWGWACFIQRRNLESRYWRPVLQIMVLILLVFMSLRAISGKLVVNDETGICSDANNVTDFLIENHIPLRQVFRTPICNMPMAYYYIRKTNAKLAETRIMPTLEDLVPKPGLDLPRDASFAWVFVNASQGESLGGVLGSEDRGRIEVIHKVSFESGYLCEIRFRR